MKLKSKSQLSFFKAIARFVQKVLPVLLTSKKTQKITLVVLDQKPELFGNPLKLALR